MEALPRRRFSRKSRSLTVALRSDPALDAIAERRWPELTRDQLRSAARMEAQGLEAVAEGLSPKDGVDLSDLTLRAWALTERTWPDEAAGWRRPMRLTAPGSRRWPLGRTGPERRGQGAPCPG